MTSTCPPVLRSGQRPNFRDLRQTTSRAYRRRDSAANPSSTPVSERPPGLGFLCHGEPRWDRPEESAPHEHESRLRLEEQDEVVARALEIIWNEAQSEPLNVNEVAQQLPVTRRTLDRRFAASLGRSVLEEINLCRISRAKQLLAETDMLVKTISFVAGFPSRERMRLLFLKEEGVSPTEYRELARAGSVTWRSSHDVEMQSDAACSFRCVS